MFIVADENIPLVKEFFSDLGDVTLLPGREISSGGVKRCDVLLVRSITPVNQELLESSAVQFVGTATTGVDHVDRDYLEAKGIGFADSAGCNTQSVVEYVLSVLFLLSEKFEFAFQDQTVGIIGSGRIGGKLRSCLEEIGVQCGAYDPWLEDRGVEGLCSLEEALSADVISLHPSLTQLKPHPSFHLINQARLKQMKTGAILINTSRGPVVDNTALINRLQETSLVTVLDVWENEPLITPELLDQVEIATPHIAGYSLDGKLKGTEMIYQSVCKFFKLEPKHSLGDWVPAAPLRKLEFNPTTSVQEIIQTAIRSCYNIYRDDWALRRTKRLDDSPRIKAFDNLRKNYPVRREFHHTQIDLGVADHPAKKVLKVLGFQL
ncbi:MAG TPA: 4-phosphoerythronate dehydrogenase [Nitrospiria bacterium]|jgi:erythronate-4-phosphate dehydrogenase